jgi:hypothetical protein
MGMVIIRVLLLHRRYHPRQEPDAAIPHVRVRAGGRREGGSYRDKQFKIVQTVLKPFEHRDGLGIFDVLNDWNVLNGLNQPHFLTS